MTRHDARESVVAPCEGSGSRPDLMKLSNPPQADCPSCHQRFWLTPIEPKPTNSRWSRDNWMIPDHEPFAEATTDAWPVHQD